MSNFEKNKEILSYCPNYYKIINEEYNEDDVVSEKLIQIYSEFVFSVNVNNKAEMKELEKINESVLKYFSVEDFRRDLCKVMVELRVKKTVENILHYVIKCINNAYEKYLESYTRNLCIPRWI